MKLIQKSKALSARSILGSASLVAVCATIVVGITLTDLVPRVEQAVAQPKSDRDAPAATAEAAPPPERIHAMDLQVYEADVSAEPPAPPSFAEPEVTAIIENTKQSAKPATEGESEMETEVEPEDAAKSEAAPSIPPPEVKSAAKITETPPEPPPTPRVSDPVEPTITPEQKTVSATPARKSAQKVGRKSQRPSRTAKPFDWQKAANSFLDCADGGCGRGEIARHVEAIITRF